MTFYSINNFIYDPLCIEIIYRVRIKIQCENLRKIDFEEKKKRLMTMDTIC